MQEWQGKKLTHSPIFDDRRITEEGNDTNFGILWEGGEKGGNWPELECRFAVVALLF